MNKTRLAYRGSKAARSVLRNPRNRDSVCNRVERRYPSDSGRNSAQRCPVRACGSKRKLAQCIAANRISSWSLRAAAPHRLVSSKDRFRGTGQLTKRPWEIKGGNQRGREVQEWLIRMLLKWWMPQMPPLFPPFMFRHKKGRMMIDISAKRHRWKRH